MRVPRGRFPRVLDVESAYRRSLSPHPCTSHSRPPPELPPLKQKPDEGWTLWLRWFEEPNIIDTRGALRYRGTSATSMPNFRTLSKVYDYGL